MSLHVDDAISSRDLEVSTGGAPGISPVAISDQELTVISVHSSDTNPDSEEEEGCLSDSLSEPVFSRWCPERPVPLTIYLLWDYGGLRVARVIPGLCRFHLVIAVRTVQTVFQTSLIRLCHEHSRLVSACWNISDISDYG